MVEMSDKHVRKYMRLAKQVGEDNNSCYSRHIGVVIIDPLTDKVLSTGQNGPVRKTPHADAKEYLEEVVWPQLTMEEKKLASLQICEDVCSKEEFCDHFANKKICPRKPIGATSGVRLEICPCVHGESNAIVNASCSLYGGWMFCWCPLCCYECTKLICQAHIKRVYCYTADKDYSHGSRWLFKKKGVEMIEYSADWYMNQE